MIDPTAAQTIALCLKGDYTARSGAIVPLAPAIAAAKAGTTLYAPAEIAALTVAGGGVPPRIEITPETTSAAIRRLFELEGVADALALNFASAVEVGGGFLRGAQAQEEDLCRTSALYVCLEAQPRYYEANRAADERLYTDHAIWTPRVPFFRDNALDLLERPSFASVLTMPAPYAAKLQGPRDAIDATLRARALKVLQIAAHRGHRTLILGAWGCGAFRNDPVVAADAFAVALERTAGAFDRVVFAIYERKKDGPNRASFEQRFSRSSRG